MEDISRVKDGTPTDEELEELGDKIVENWKKLGRRLCVTDSKLLEIEKDHEQISEKGYYMLKHWKQEKGCAATYQALCGALKHKLVQRQDLAEQFCYINGPFASQLPAGHVAEEKVTEEVCGASAGVYRRASAKHQEDSTEVKSSLKQKRLDPNPDQGNLPFKISCLRATSRNSGNQDPEEEREKVNRYMKEKIDEVNSQGIFDFSDPMGIRCFYMYLMGELYLQNVTFQSSSIKVIVKCRTLEILENLWCHYCSGQLNAVAEECLITENVKEELGMETIKLKTTILEEDYVTCKLCLMEIPVMAESQVRSPSDAKLDFDDLNLKAIATVYLEEGNKEYRRKEASNALSFYTQGLQVNCKDDILNAKLYSNRATAYFSQGNYQETLNDAEAAVTLQPTFIKAIERGASACVKLKRYEEATSWCDEGLAIDKNNKTLVDLRTKCPSQPDASLETRPQNMKGTSVTHIATGQKTADSIPKSAKDKVEDKIEEGYANHGQNDFEKAIIEGELLLNVAKEVGDKHREEVAYNKLGTAYQRVGQFKTAIDYHQRQLKIAKEVGHKAGEAAAYCNLGCTYTALGDFKTSIDYLERRLKIAKEVEDKAGEGGAYGNLGNAYRNLGDFKTALDYHERHLKIAKEVGDKAGEGNAYGNLGNAYQCLGDFKTAIDYYERHLKIAKEMGHKDGEGKACCNLGSAFQSVGDFKTAIDYQERHLKIAKEMGDKAGEGKAYCNLGNAYLRLCDFKTAIDYYERCLKIAKEVGDRAGEGKAYCNLGNAYDALGDFKTAIDYHERDLKITKEVGNKDGEGRVYCNLGNAYQCLGDIKTAVHYHKRQLKIAKEVGDNNLEGSAYGNIGNVYQRLGDFKTATDYHERHLKIAKELGDKAGEGRAYGNLGNAYRSLGDIKTALDYYKRNLEIAKEVGDKAGIARSFLNLGECFELKESLPQAINCFHSSVKFLNIIRHDLKGEDELKFNYRNTRDTAYTSLWRLLLEQGEVEKALFAAEEGRAQALNDLMELSYGLETTYSQSPHPEGSALNLLLSFPRSVTVFIAINEQDIVFWVVQDGKDVQLRKKKLGDQISSNLNDYLRSLIMAASRELNVRACVNCEDRSLDKLDDENVPNDLSPQTPATPVPLQMSVLRTLYDLIIDPIADLIHGDELILVPEGPLCLASYAALLDSNSRCFCDVCRIRVIPSLTTLKLITDSPNDYHSKTGVLLVGDPWVEEVVISDEKKLEQLPFARKEVEMIGRILKTTPLIGRVATKDEVLRRLSSVALIHIAAHGRMETGEIALAPNTTRTSQVPAKEDFLLTMKDVTSARIHARLVVLSCCHSGRGEIKAEGVVGIARAFLGAGARAVLVSLWAIDDAATLEFMKSFYTHLVNGISASESLNRAMKYLRESKEFNEVKFWAPFLLIGDDVAMELGGTEFGNCT